MEAPDSRSSAGNRLDLGDERESAVVFAAVRTRESYCFFQPTSGDANVLYRWMNDNLNPRAWKALKLRAFGAPSHAAGADSSGVSTPAPVERAAEVTGESGRGRVRALSYAAEIESKPWTIAVTGIPAKARESWTRHSSQTDGHRLDAGRPAEPPGALKAYEACSYGAFASDFDANRAPVSRHIPSVGEQAGTSPPAHMEDARGKLHGEKPWPASRAIPGTSTPYEPLNGSMLHNDVNALRSSLKKSSVRTVGQAVWLSGCRAVRRSRPPPPRGAGCSPPSCPSSSEQAEALATMILPDSGFSQEELKVPAGESSHCSAGRRSAPLDPIPRASTGGAASEEAIDSQGTTRSFSHEPVALSTSSSTSSGSARYIGTAASYPSTHPGSVDAMPGFELLLDPCVSFPKAEVLARCITSLGPLGAAGAGRAGWCGYHAGSRAAATTPWRDTVGDCEVHDLVPAHAAAGTRHEEKTQKHELFLVRAFPLFLLQGLGEEQVRLLEGEGGLALMEEVLGIRGLVLVTLDGSGRSYEGAGEEKTSRGDAAPIARSVVLGATRTSESSCFFQPTPKDANLLELWLQGNLYAAPWHTAQQQSRVPACGDRPAYAAGGGAATTGGLSDACTNLKVIAYSTVFDAKPQLLIAGSFGTSNAGYSEALRQRGECGESGVYVGQAQNLKHHAASSHHYIVLYQEQAPLTRNAIMYGDSRAENGRFAERSATARGLFKGPTALEWQRATSSTRSVQCGIKSMQCGTVASSSPAGCTGMPAVAVGTSGVKSMRPAPARTTERSAEPVDTLKSFAATESGHSDAASHDLTGSYSMGSSTTQFASIGEIDCAASVEATISHQCVPWGDKLAVQIQPIRLPEVATAGGRPPMRTTSRVLAITCDASTMRVPCKEYKSSNDALSAESSVSRAAMHANSSGSRGRVHAKAWASIHWQAPSDASFEAGNASANGLEMEAARNPTHGGLVPAKAPSSAPPAAGRIQSPPHQQSSTSRGSTDCARVSIKDTASPTEYQKQAATRRKVLFSPLFLLQGLGEEQVRLLEGEGGLALMEEVLGIRGLVLVTLDRT